MGRHLVARLTNAGHRVRVLGRSEKTQSHFVDNNHEYCRIVDDSVDGFFKHIRDFPYVVDLAYATVPKTSYTDPIHDIQANLPRVVNLFRACINANARKVVYVSTGGAVYGNTHRIPISESCPAQPVSPYGITKLAIEKYAYLFYTNEKLPVVCLRPSTAYGEWQKPFRGQGYVATALASLWSGKTITLFGHGNAIRDFIHAEDIASAIDMGLTRGVDGFSYNVGTGKGFDLYQMLKTISQVSGQEIRSGQVDLQPSRPFDAATNILDCSLFNEHTGWSPSISLTQGLERTCEHFRTFKDWYIGVSFDT